jgi:hypothetical protein
MKSEARREVEQSPTATQLETRVDIESVPQREHVHYYKDQLVNVKEITAFYYEDHMKHINTLCGQNAELLAVKSSGILSFIALK